MPLTLKKYLGAYKNPSRLVGLPGDCPEGRTCYARVWRAELGSVEQVQKLCMEAQRDCFAQRDVPSQVQVQIARAVGANLRDVRRKRAQCERRLSGERPGVEPFLQCRVNF